MYRTLQHVSAELTKACDSANSLRQWPHAHSGRVSAWSGNVYYTQMQRWPTVVTDWLLTGCLMPSPHSGMSMLAQEDSCYVSLAVQPSCLASCSLTLVSHLQMASGHTFAGQKFSKPPSSPIIPPAGPSSQLPSSPSAHVSSSFLAHQAETPSVAPLNDDSHQPGTSDAHMHRQPSHGSPASSQHSGSIMLPQLQDVDLENVEQVCGAAVMPAS